MKNKLKFNIAGSCHAAGLAVLLIAPGARAQNLFALGGASGNITELTPGGTQSTFASGLQDPNSMAFNSEGDLFAVDYDASSIVEYPTGGAKSTFD